MTELTRRNFLAGSGMAVAGAVAATGLAAGGGADRAHADEQAAEGRVYQVITDELNPQDYDYRQNSGDLSHVLSPWKLGNMEFSNRIVKSAAGSNYENGGWDKFVEYYRRLAAGGTEMIWVENFAHVFLPYKNRINANIDEFTDEQITALTDAIHAEGAKCGNQLDTMGSGWFSEITSRNPAGAYDAADMTEDDIEYTIQSYVDGVKQLQKWGFDAFELNCAGNNIPQWFMSPARNTRTDKYGAQTYESRTQFVREIVERIHAECGEDFPVQVLMNAIEENDESMGDNAALNTMEDGIEIAKQLEQAGVASLHLRLGTLEQHATQFLGDLFFDPMGSIGSTSFGTQFDFHRHFQGMLVADHDGCGLMLNISERYKQAVSIPVGTVTYLDPAHAPDFIDGAIADGKVDFLMINRPLTVDNNYVSKLREGKIDEIRPCSRCCHCWNDAFRGDGTPLSSKFGAMSYSCRYDAVRDMVGQDRGLPGGFDPDPAESPRNIMVVGGGPAGMEAARVAAERGHNVTLYEKQGYLGGLMNFMSAIKGPHQNLADYIAWSEGDLGRKGVTVITGQEVTADFVAEQAPDAVILATGGLRDAPALAGDDKTNVVPVADVAAAEIGQHVTILGGNCQACDVATYLLAQGKHVTIVMPDPINDLSKGQSIWCRKFSIPMLYTRGTRVWEQAELLEAAGGQARVKTVHGAETTSACDTVVDARDMLPNEGLADELKAASVEVHEAGDCCDPWNIQYAVRSGNIVGRTI